MRMHGRDNGKGKGGMRGTPYYAAHDKAVRCAG